MKKIIPALSLALLSVGTAQASMITVTLEGRPDWSTEGLGDGLFSFVASFDSSQLTGKPYGAFSVDGTVSVSLNGSGLGGCTVVGSGCAGSPDVHESGVNYYEYEPGQYIALPWSVDASYSGYIGLFRNQDGSFDLSRTNLSVAQSYSTCSSNLIFGDMCYGSGTTMSTDGTGFVRYNGSYGRTSEMGLTVGTISSWSISPVPEPDAGVMGAIGMTAMLALAIARRRAQPGRPSSLGRDSTGQ
ncbi:hypothetical protein [Derxia gummosa]|uniref:PEP-CTERM sorting domain-containing protein n=1 Tax=Derxia gummosa DSM 723 TaxID=1121388 RepID=A0A8B6XC80_9BURK|nr:hypothetical protein [Derxia gummosa]